MLKINTRIAVRESLGRRFVTPNYKIYLKYTQYINLS